MLDKSIYEYLCFCEDKSVRGILVITDKQSIFYVQDEFDNSTHDELYMRIENRIHPNDIKDGWNAIRNNNIHIASVGHEFIIYLPEDRTLSMNQYVFLTDMLNEVEKYNVDKDKKVLLYALYPERLNERFKSRDLSEVKDKLYSLVTKDIIIDEELIIGKTLDKNTIINNMKYHIDIESSLLLIDVYVSIKRCDMYYNDSYYKDYLISIFPDYIEVVNLIKRFNYDELFEIEINDVTLLNIKEVLIRKLNKDKVI